MEHEIDESTERRLAAFTDAISMAERNKEVWLKELLEKLDSPNDLPIPLCLMSNGSGGVIARVTAQYELRKRLSAAGFIPGVEISDIKKFDDAQMLYFVFTMNGMEIKFGITEASAIWLYQP
jgi:hypothetical protein